MTIEKNTVVSLRYQMYDEKNQLIDETQDEPMVYLHGGYDGIFPKVEEALHGKNIGDNIDVQLSVDDAFGEIDAELLRIENEKTFPVQPEVGMMFEADDPETGEMIIFRVTDIADGKVIIDGNHPLAGMKIRFVATVTDIRPASAEEIAHGHVHGAHGHHH